MAAPDEEEDGGSEDQPSVIEGKVDEAANHY